jgi:valyl-tRNA synthetase
LWGSMGARGGNLLIHARWPAPIAEVDVEVKADLEWLVGAISTVRAERTSLGIPPSARLEAIAYVRSESANRRLSEYAAPLERQARLVSIDLSGQDIDLNNYVEVVVDDSSLYLRTEGVFDRDARIAELAKGIEAAEKEAASLAGRLNNPAFVEKAKPEAVEKARADHAEKSAEAERFRAALARLG